MGKAKHGSDRMYGLGVRASDISGVLPSRSACYRESMFWKSANKDLMEKSNEVAELKAMILEMRGSNQNTSSASSVRVTSVGRPKATIELQPLNVGDVFRWRLWQEGGLGA